MNGDAYNIINSGTQLSIEPGKILFGNIFIFNEGYVNMPKYSVQNLNNIILNALTIVTILNTRGFQRPGLFFLKLTIASVHIT